MTEAVASFVGAADPDLLNAAVVRIRAGSAAPDPAGLGVLIAQDLVLTCAHVVAHALGLAERDPLPAGARVTLDLPLQHGTGQPDTGVTASIRTWGPDRENDPLDLALLHLDQPLPRGRPAWMVEAGPQQLWGHTARVFGLPGGHNDGVWHAAVLRGRQAGGLVQADTVGLGYPVSSGFSGSPVWDQELGGVVGLMAEAEAGELPVSYMIPTARVIEAWPHLGALTRPPSPFRGLLPFTDSDSTVFFGRRKEVDDLAQTVAEARWTTLLGPSGCGKSSLAMAGIAPTRRGEGDCVIILKPERPVSPLRALAAALVPLLEPNLPAGDRPARYDTLVANLTEHGLRDLAPLVLQQQNRRRLLLVIDQFEDLLRLDEGDAEAFADALTPARLPQSVSVLATLRADLLAAVLERPYLAPLTETTKNPDDTAHALIQVRTLAPMRPEQLREIITLPLAAIPGIDYEPGLIELILGEARAEKGILPLLAYTLARLWQAQHGGRLTHDAYKALGGVKGALRTAAARAWDRIEDEDKPAAKRLLTRLVWVPEGEEPPTGRTATRDELGEPAWHIARRLAAAKLLILDGTKNPDGTTVESVKLAHDALITAWDELDEQVAANREFLAWLQSLRHDLARWRRAGHKSDLLPTPSTLDNAEQWVKERSQDLSPDERDYLNRGLAYHRSRTRRRRAALSGAAALSALALVFVSLFLYAQRQDREAAAQANSRALAQASQDASTSDPAQAIMLALAAYRSSATQEARNQLLREYLAYSSYSRMVSGLPGHISKVQASSDGNVIIAVADDGKAMLFTHVVDGTVTSFPIPSDRVRFVLLTPNGREAGFVNEEGSAGWFAVNPDAPQPIGPVHTLPIPGFVSANPDYNDLPWSAAISADGTLMDIQYCGTGYGLTTGSGDIVWHLPAGKADGGIDLPGAKVNPSATAPADECDNTWFSANDRELLAEVQGSDPDSNSLVATDLATGSTRTLITSADKILVSSEGTTAAVCREPNQQATVTLQRLSDGALLAPPYHEGSICDLDAVAATGHYILTTGLADPDTPQDVFNLIDLDTGKLISQVRSINAGLTGTSAIDFPNLVSVGGEPGLVTNDATTIGLIAFPTGARAPGDRTQALTPDGKAIISISPDGSTINRYSVATGRLLAQAPHGKPGDSNSDALIRQSPTGPIADLEGDDLVAIHDGTTLRVITKITPSAPPQTPGSSGSSIDYFFDAAGHLITVSGTVVQEWDARTGRQLASFDASKLHLATKGAGPPSITVSPYTAANQVAVVGYEDPLIRIVDLTTGRTITSIDTGGDAISIAFEHSGRYFALARSGGQVELWQRDPLKRDVGPLPILAQSYNTDLGSKSDASQFTVGFMHNGKEFLAAAGSAINIYDIGDHDVIDHYDFSYPTGLATAVSNAPFSMVDVSADGTVALYTYGDAGALTGTIKLDPDEWRNTLCNVIADRNFTPDERDGLPVQVPTQPVCEER